ncbi:cyclase family protein [Nocardiopsis suaedae]|uniref:cyclase family protein n=1 Tax=Nocardiopsis suaedae TaxID=3018444 RepID=UPI0038CD2841
MIFGSRPPGRRSLRRDARAANQDELRAPSCERRPGRPLADRKASEKHALGRSWAPSRRPAAAPASGGGRVLDLSYTYGPGMPAFHPGKPSFEVIAEPPPDGEMAEGPFYDLRWTFNEHTGTHLDAPAHVVGGTPAASGRDARRGGRPLHGRAGRSLPCDRADEVIEAVRRGASSGGSVAPSVATPRSRRIRARRTSRSPHRFSSSR